MVKTVVSCSVKLAGLMFHADVDCGCHKQLLYSPTPQKNMRELVRLWLNNLFINKFKKHESSSLILFLMFVCGVCIIFSASSIHGLPGLKQTEQKREEPFEGSAEETEEEGAMAAQSAGAGAGERALTAWADQSLLQKYYH